MAKSDNPILKSCFIGKLFFTWVTGILRLSVTRSIDEDDVYFPLEEHLSNTIANRFKLLWQHEIKTNKSPSLLRVLLKEFGFSIFNSNAWFSLAEMLFRIVQCYSLGGLISFFTLGQTAITRNEALIYALGISGTTFVMAVMYHPFTFYNFQRSLKIRVGLCSLIYDKILSLTKCTTVSGLNGQAISLMTNDISKFDLPLSMLYIIWKGPLDAIIFGYILYLEIGISVIYAVIFVTVFIPVQVWISKKSAIYNDEVSKRTNRRLKFMNEILHGIQMIKMYAWEKSFARIVNNFRRREITTFRKLYSIKAGISTLYAISRISLFLCLISYVYLGDTLTARQVFMVSAFLMDLNRTLVYTWPAALAEIVGTYVATKRISTFLLNSGVNQLTENPTSQENVHKNTNRFGEPNELNKLLNSNDLTTCSHDSKTENGIEFKNVSAVWSQGGSTFGIDSISFHAKMNSLYVIIGQVGCGKSSLLNVIIGEIKPNKGYVEINGTISYVSQEPWLFDGTIRQNIIFIEPYDKEQYQEVCRVCALDIDFEQLPLKDLTVIGERGVGLSEGQKARINLARAIYRKADLYLLDDPLSAVDTKTGKHIFTECIQKYLSKKCVLLITHQHQYLNDLQNIILLSNEHKMKQGSFKELNQVINNSLQVQEILDSREYEAHSPYIQETTKLLTNLEADKSKDEILKEGSISYQTYLNYMKSVRSTPRLITVAILIVSYQLSLMGIDYFLVIWVNWEEPISYTKNTTHTTLNTNMGFNNTTKQYLSNSTELIIKTREHYILIFAFLTILVVYLMSHRNFAFYGMCLRASENLHNNLFQGICYVTMLFFNSNSSGRILNRFAKDIQVVDIRIPTTLIDTLQSMMEVICTGLAVSIINRWALFPTILYGIFILSLRMIYTKVSSSLNRIQAVTGSSIYSQINTTIQGLSTIRSFNAENVLMNQFGVLINNQTGAMYLCNAVATAFALWLDIATGLYVACIAVSCLLLVDITHAGQVGFILTKAIVLIGATSWGIRQSTELENNMVSVERIMEYSNLEPEPDRFEKHPPDSWPEFGCITVSNLSLKYNPDAPYVLKNLCFDIKSGEKIGIVGRTGAGKSSLMQALFRLGLIEGIIKIDHVNIFTLPLQYLRKNIAILPQDPTLFSGSIRNNLDPFRNKSDAELWCALDHVQMKSIVAKLPGGLDFVISEGGSNFSLGQRQLICLARVILRKTKILILDEATSNVDLGTIKLIQNTIKHKFVKCTVITVAHRLDTVMECDRILVMDAGHIVEFDTPIELFKKSNNYLQKLKDQS